LPISVTITSVSEKRDIMKKRISRTLDKMIEENKREILLNQISLNDIEKKVDIKIIANGK
jgi:hypothetical protein